MNKRNNRKGKMFKDMEYSEVLAIAIKKTGIEVEELEALGHEELIDVIIEARFK